MHIIQVLIPSDRVHIGIKAGSGRETIPAECHPLPFCQRMDDLNISLELQNIKPDRAFHPVEVVVQAGLGAHKKRRRNTGKRKRLRQFPLEGILGQLNCNLGFHDVELGKIVGRQNQIFHRHGIPSSFPKNTKKII